MQGEKSSNPLDFSLRKIYTVKIMMNDDPYGQTTLGCWEFGARNFPHRLLITLYLCLCM